MKATPVHLVAALGTMLLTALPTLALPARQHQFAGTIVSVDPGSKSIVLARTKGPDKQTCLVWDDLTHGCLSADAVPLCLKPGAEVRGSFRQLPGRKLIRSLNCGR